MQKTFKVLAFQCWGLTLHSGYGQPNELPPVFPSKLSADVYDGRQQVMAQVPLSATHVGDPDAAAGSWLWSRTTLSIVVRWQCNSTWKINIYLSICHYLSLPLPPSLPSFIFLLFKQILKMYNPCMWFHKMHFH